MQVQSIQSTNINNNSFKATFVNDANGNFRRVWHQQVKFSDNFKNQVYNFTQNKVGHKLEIIHLTEDKAGSILGFTFFNHRTGEKAYFANKINESHNILSNFFNDIFGETFETIFWELQNAELFQKLTGQK